MYLKRNDPRAAGSVVLAAPARAGSAAQRTVNTGLISSDDGVYRLFEADPFSPQRRRLKMLATATVTAKHLTWYETTTGVWWKSAATAGAPLHPAALA